MTSIYHKSGAVGPCLVLSILFKKIFFLCSFLLKSSGPERRSSRRSTDSSSKAQEEALESEGREDEDEEDEEDRVAEEHPPPPAMSSWSSDHNYIAVAPEKTTAISPTVLNKACMYLKGFPHFNLWSLCDLWCRTHMRNEMAFWPRSPQAVTLEI